MRERKREMTRDARDVGPRLFHGSIVRGTKKWVFWFLWWGVRVERERVSLEAPTTQLPPTYPVIRGPILRDNPERDRDPLTHVGCSPITQFGEEIRLRSLPLSSFFLNPFFINLLFPFFLPFFPSFWKFPPFFYISHHMRRYLFFNPIQIFFFNLPSLIFKKKKLLDFCFLTLKEFW